MRVLAVGGTGFIGARVARLLGEWGHDVAVLSRGRTRGDLPGDVLRLRGDRDELARVRSKLLGFRPDVVLDVVPYTESQARQLMVTFRGRARRVVAVSSADVYRNYDGFRRRATAPPDPEPLAEDAPLRATRYPYRGESLPFAWADEYDKILVEQAVMAEPSLPGTVLRLPAVYGPGDAQHRVGFYLGRMSGGRPAVFLAKEQAEWRWTRGYVENVAAAIALAVTDDRAAGRVYNVGEEPAPTERQWAESIARAAGWRGQIIDVPAARLPEHLRRPFDFRYDLATDTSRIREELGYEEPVDRDEAMARTARWERLRPLHVEPTHLAAEDELFAALEGSP